MKSVLIHSCTPFCVDLAHSFYSLFSTKPKVIILFDFFFFDYFLSVFVALIIPFWLKKTFACMHLFSVFFFYLTAKKLLAFNFLYFRPAGKKHDTILSEKLSQCISCFWWIAAHNRNAFNITSAASDPLCKHVMMVNRRRRRKSLQSVTPSLLNSVPFMGSASSSITVRSRSISIPKPYCSWAASRGHRQRASVTLQE